MPRLASLPLLCLSLLLFVACAAPATPTVTLAQLSTPIASPSRPAPTAAAVKTATALPPTDTPAEPPAALLAPQFRLIEGLGITAEYRGDAVGISYSASASGFAWARQEATPDGTKNTYPGLVFV